MSSSAIKLLVADDCPAIHQIIERAAAAYSDGPIQYVRANDGRECLHALAKGAIDLALIDVFMPEMSGLEVLDNARFMGKETFIALMSARPDDRAFELARRLKAYEFLIKPFGVKDVEAILKSYQRMSRPLTALIVDDSATTRRIIRRVLERSMFRINIEEAGDGNSGLDLCRTGAADIVFLDCNMPGLSGLDTLDRLRGHNPENRVIMISAMRGGSLEQQALEHGAAAFLYKPFYPNDVDAVIHQIFDLRSPRLMIVKPRILKSFDVTVVSRTVEVMHRDSGHFYRFLWFRDAPHLRAAHVLPNPNATQGVGAFRAEAEKAAVLQLESAGLLDRASGHAEPVRPAAAVPMQPTMR